MTKLPHGENIIKPDTIIIHYPNVSFPITEPFCPVALSEYLNWGWKSAASKAGDVLHLIHPQAPYRRA